MAEAGAIGFVPPRRDWMLVVAKRKSRLQREYLMLVEDPVFSGDNDLAPALVQDIRGEHANGKS